MPIPTFVNSFSTGYTTTGSPKTVSVTTQAGDLLVVYAATADTATLLNAPSGNGISFTAQQTFTTSSNCAGYLWTGTDTTGGTNWTLSISTALGSLMWGFTCVVFRNSAGFGVSGGTTNQSGAPSTALTTQVNSALVVFSADWLAVDGASRTWLSINSITPSVGNGLELTYARDSANYTVYGAYYSDAGAAGSDTAGLSAPTGQKYTIAVMEVLAGSGTPTASVGWLQA